MIFYAVRSGKRLEVIVQDYIKSSIELHLFFARIMKEHALFLRAGFMPTQSCYIKEAMWYKGQFEKLLSDVVKLSNCVVSPEILNSGEIVTNYTLDAEKKTEEFTGIKIDTNITCMELQELTCDPCKKMPDISSNVSCLNDAAINLLDGLIDFKQRILNDVLNCCIFTVNYPLLIEHIMREAKLYRQYVWMLQNGIDINSIDMKQVELFWNQIMMEHAEFIRGLLDPTQEELIAAANDFANGYKELLEEAKAATETSMRTITNETITETAAYVKFKTAGVQGITECKIRSIILPLLADHVLREANHYFRILNS